MCFPGYTYSRKLLGPVSVGEGVPNLGEIPLRPQGRGMPVEGDGSTLSKARWRENVMRKCRRGTGTRGNG